MGVLFSVVLIYLIIAVLSTRVLNVSKESAMLLFILFLSYICCLCTLLLYRNLRIPEKWSFSKCPLVFILEFIRFAFNCIFIWVKLTYPWCWVFSALNTYSGRPLYSHIGFHHFFEDLCITFWIIVVVWERYWFLFWVDHFVSTLDNFFSSSDFSVVPIEFIRLMVISSTNNDNFVFANNFSLYCI